jgi:hypothetical protein
MGHLTDEELAPLREALEVGGRLGFAGQYFSKYGVGVTVDELGFGPRPPRCCGHWRTGSR